MLRFYRQFVGRGDLCFDVGANIGNRTNVFLQLGARVVAVEPQQVCCTELRRRFEGHSSFTLVDCVLGPHPGRAVLRESNAHTLSSLSATFIQRVQASGRFPRGEYRWDRPVEVEMTTLDRLIDSYGLPRFCKIDVEGFEFEVLRGLSRPIDALSFEFAVEHLEPTRKSLSHLENLSMGSFNFSFGETMTWARSRWVAGAELAREIESLADPLAWGDVYARVVGTGR